MLGRKRFFAALSAGETQRARRLLAEHPHLANAVEAMEGLQGDEPAPALLLATEIGAAPLVEALLEAGADVNGRGHLGGTALHWAARGGRSEIAYLLLAFGAPVDLRCVAFGAPPLWWAVEPCRHQTEATGDGRLGVVSALLEAGASRRAEDRAGRGIGEMLPKALDDPLRRVLAPSLS